MESARKRTVICRKKPIRDWMQKSQYFKAVLVYDLQTINGFFLSAEGGVGSFDNGGSKGR